MKSYLDIIGLSYLWSKITLLFYKKTEVNAISTHKTYTSYGYSQSIDGFSGIVKGDSYIGVGDSQSDVYGVNACKKTNFDAREEISLTSDDDYIFIIYPSSADFKFKPKINGLSIPVTTISDSITGYVILKSQNRYTGTFSIAL